MDTRLALSDAKGPLGDLLEKLSSESGGTWLSALNRMLRKENPWGAETFRFAFRGEVRKANELKEYGFDRWERDIPVTPGEIEIELGEFLKPKEEWVKGTVMDERTFIAGSNLGLGHALEMYERRDEIPVELRKFVLVFTGTVLVRGHGGRYVAYLHWLGDQWYLGFRWLGRDFISRDRVLRSRK